MMELGNDLMEGLRNGIQDKDREVAQTLTDSIGKMLDAAKSALGDFRSKMQDFAGGISGGFDQFLQLGVTEEGGFTGPDLGSAQQFAQSLKALETQGAGKQLLGALAGTDLATVQALLQQGPASHRGAEQAVRRDPQTGRPNGQGTFAGLLRREDGQAPRPRRPHRRTAG